MFDPISWSQSYEEINIVKDHFYNDVKLSVFFVGHFFRTMETYDDTGAQSTASSESTLPLSQEDQNLQPSTISTSLFITGAIGVGVGILIGHHSGTFFI